MKTRIKAIKSKEEKGKWTIGFKRSNMNNFRPLDYIHGTFSTKQEAIEKLESTLENWSGYAIGENLYIIHEER
jgi:hypothetical protein